MPQNNEHKTTINCINSQNNVTYTMEKMVSQQNHTTTLQLNKNISKTDKIKYFYCGITMIIRTSYY